ncbi:uncharacterized protein LOC144446063 isoform X1 [Glandiceps talaboti]
MAEGRAGDRLLEGDDLKVRRFTHNEEEEEALGEKIQRFWEEGSSINSPKSISSSCSRSKEDGCCDNCPMKAPRGRNLCASAWTEKQAGALKYICRGFPYFSNYDNPQIDDYYRHLNCSWRTKWTLLSCFTPIVQWLFNSVRVKTPDGEKTVHAVPVSDAIKGEIQSELEVSMLQLEEPNSCMGRLVNHGVPNSKMKLLKLDGSPVLCLFTIKDIEEGEEILCDYGVKNLPWEQKQVHKGRIFYLF